MGLPLGVVRVAVGVVAVVRVGDAVDAARDAAQGLRAGRGGSHPRRLRPGCWIGGSLDTSNLDTVNSSLLYLII
jgi:hypothetical protein